VIGLDLSFQCKIKYLNSDPNILEFGVITYSGPI
jgi:hypothetical protein